MAAEARRYHTLQFLFICFNPLPNKPCFLRVCSTSLLKTLWEKEKLLVTSNFSFSRSVFYLFGEVFCHFHQIWNSRLQTLSFWKSKKFVVWEGVNSQLLRPKNNAWVFHLNQMLSIICAMSFPLYCQFPIRSTKDQNYRRLQDLRYWNFLVLYYCERIKEKKGMIKIKAFLFHSYILVIVTSLYGLWWRITGGVNNQNRTQIIQSSRWKLVW